MTVICSSLNHSLTSLEVWHVALSCWNIQPLVTVSKWVVRISAFRLSKRFFNKSANIIITKCYLLETLRWPLTVLLRLKNKTSKVRENINHINVVLFRALHCGCRCLCRPKSNALKKHFKRVLSAVMFTRFKLGQCARMIRRTAEVITELSNVLSFSSKNETYKMFFTPNS